MGINLAQLKVGDKGEIVTVKSKGEVRRRLLDMGVVKFAKFKVLRVAPLGDPIEIFIKGFNLSLRVNEAEEIIVKKIGEVGDGKPMGKRRNYEEEYNHNRSHSR